MKILGYDYKVVQAESVEFIDAFGRLHIKSQTIQISSDICEQQISSTLMHEIIEAINYHLQLGLEHKVIFSLETSLYQVFTENGVDLSPLTNQIEKK